MCSGRRPGTGRMPKRPSMPRFLGYTDPADAAPESTGCTTLAGIDDGVGLNNDEQRLPVLRCRVTEAWTTLWPQLHQYD